MDIRTLLQNEIVLLDGGLGTLLQGRGLPPGAQPERWNLTHPDVVQQIHRAYYEAGCHIVSTNTFGANSLHFGEEELAALIAAAVENARAARAAMPQDGRARFIALDIGPCGRLLRPLGDLDFEEAVAIFKRTVSLGVAQGVDLILIETMNDSYETKAAVLAAKECCDLPIFVSNAYSEDGKLMTGASPSAMVALLEGLGVDALGANCSLGPHQLRGVVDELLSCASCPVLLMPNAGLPQLTAAGTVYDITEEEFACEVAEACRRGVRVAGGCCGTTPAYIAALAARLQGLAPVPLTDKGLTCVSSYTHAVIFGDRPCLIGERINPTGKKRLKEALLARDMDYLLGEGISQQEKGVHLLDVNVGMPGVDECEMLTAAVCELQAVCDLPLQIDTADPRAMEQAMRRYNGKPLVNSVTGKQESLKAVLPLVKKYGGVLIALTLDEDGIPETAEGRVAIAERILAVAGVYGIARKNIIFDTLAMSISADPSAACVTLAALQSIRQRYGCHTSLGVSNISFGLPGRDLINGIFFAAALERGLSCAIMNPHSAEMMKTYYAYNALHGLDENCQEYISFATCATPCGVSAPSALAEEKGQDPTATPLQHAIAKGLKEQAGLLTDEALRDRSPLTLVQDEIVPALDTVGRGYEEKRVFLPQLLMAAEAAKAAFDRIKSAMMGSGKNSPTRCPVILATVQGDIHDIGKNIVRLLLENYGFAVRDLGRDVPPATILAAVESCHAPLCGLSALMTTTLPAMAAAVSLLRERAPYCRIVVGGAVLTAEYAKEIGADHYAHDAMDTVRYAEAVSKTL